MEFNNPPEDLNGAKNIDVSIHVGESYKEPVQRHCPFIQAPFLLQ